MAIENIITVVFQLSAILAGVSFIFVVGALFDEVFRILSQSISISRRWRRD